METSNSTHLIPLKDINVSNLNVRLTDTRKDIEELAKSIEKHGLLQPVVLRGSFCNPPYELVVGQRRYLAHKKLRKKNINAVFAGALGDIEGRILSLAENMQRVELNHADKAKAINDLFLYFGNDEKRVADELGLSVPTIREYIQIDFLATTKAKELLRKREISKEDVKRVIKAAQGDKQKADQLLQTIPKLSKYEKERAVSYGKRNPKASATEIIEDAKKVKYEKTIILVLTDQVDTALNKAKKQLSLDREAIALVAISDWLRNNGFLRT